MDFPRQITSSPLTIAHLRRTDIVKRGAQLHEPMSANILCFHYTDVLRCKAFTTQLVSHPDPHSNDHNVQTLKALGMQSSTICDMLHFLYSGGVEILGDHKVLEVGKWSFAMKHRPKQYDHQQPGLHDALEVVGVNV